MFWVSRSFYHATGVCLPMEFKRSILLHLFFSGLHLWTASQDQAFLKVLVNYKGRSLSFINLQQGDIPQVAIHLNIKIKTRISHKFAHCSLLPSSSSFTKNSAVATPSTTFTGPTKARHKVKYCHARHSCGFNATCQTPKASGATWPNNWCWTSVKEKQCWNYHMWDDGWLDG